MTIIKKNKRKKIHNRTVHCEGFLREDGLWDIEGHLRDTKTYSFESDHRGEVKAGTAIHDMTIRLTLDDNLNIIVISLHKKDYVLSEISRLIEENNGKIITLWQEITNDKINVHLALNCIKCDTIIRTLERYEYNVTQTFSQPYCG